MFTEAQLTDWYDEFTASYITAALWSTDDGQYGEDSGPLDANYDASDIHPDALDKIREECHDFVGANWRLLRNLNAGQCGHDFLLTRDGHGTGFWDRGYAREVGISLTAASHPYGDSGFYVGDDGKVHVS